MPRPQCCLLTPLTIQTCYPSHLYSRDQSSRKIKYQYFCLFAIGNLYSTFLLQHDRIARRDSLTIDRQLSANQVHIGLSAWIYIKTCIFTSVE